MKINMRGGFGGREAPEESEATDLTRGRREVPLYEDGRGGPLPGGGIRAGHCKTRRSELRKDLELGFVPLAQWIFWAGSFLSAGHRHVHCGVMSSLPGSPSSPRCDNPECLQTSPNVPWEAKSPVRTSSDPGTGNKLTQVSWEPKFPEMKVSKEMTIPGWSPVRQAMNGEEGRASGRVAPDALHGGRV